MTMTISTIHSFNSWMERDYSPCQERNVCLNFYFKLWIHLGEWEDSQSR